MECFFSAIIENIRKLIQCDEVEEDSYDYSLPEFNSMIVLAVIGGYALVSYVFLKKPTWLHRRKKCKFVATHISHRGGAAENLENTLTAFHHAIGRGTDMLELDVHITADGKVVVCHDNCLERTTGYDVLVTETNYKDLPPLKPQLSLDFDSDHITHEKGGDRRIVELREVFEDFPDVPINIDIKINNDLLMEKVNELIEEYRREEITVWGNKDNAIVKKLYKLNPRVPILFSLKRVMHILFLFYTGLLPFVPLKESFYEIVMPSVILRRAENLSFGFRAVLKFADIVLMNKAMFEHLQDRGIQVYLWVLNEPEDFARAFSYGVDGVMTDCPTKLTRFLEQNSQFCRKHSKICH